MTFVISFLLFSHFQLSEKVSMNNAVKTIPIPKSDKILKENQICMVAGWGKTESNKYSDDLRVAKVSIINSQVCQKEWDNTLPPNVICAGGYETTKGFCQVHLLYFLYINSPNIR